MKVIIKVFDIRDRSIYVRDCLGPFVPLEPTFQPTYLPKSCPEKQRQQTAKIRKIYKYNTYPEKNIQ